MNTPNSIETDDKMVTIKIKKTDVALAAGYAIGAVVGSFCTAYFVKKEYRKLMQHIIEETD